MATRFHFPSVAGTVPLSSLAYGAGWNKTSQATRRLMVTNVSNSTRAGRVMTSSATTPEFHCNVQYQFPGLAAQTISGTLKGQIQGWINNVSGIWTTAITARVVSSDGATLRGWLIGPTPQSSDASSTPPVINATDSDSVACNRPFQTSSEGTSHTLTEVTVLANDVLIIEVGARDVNTSTSVQCNLVFGDPNTLSDLPEDSVQVLPGNAWIEFSQTIALNTDTVTTISNNTGASFSGTEDTQIREVAATTNYSTVAVGEINRWASNDRTNTLIRFTGLPNIPAGSVVISASLQFNLKFAGDAAIATTIEMRRLLRNWVAAQVTWNNYATGAAWASAGGFGAADRSNTLTASLNVGITTGAIVFSSAQLAADVQSFIDGVNPNYGWIFSRNDALADAQYRSISYSEDTNGLRPILTVVYTSGSGGGTFDLQGAIDAADLGDVVSAPVNTYGPVLLPLYLTGVVTSLTGVQGTAAKGNVTPQGGQNTIRLTGVQAIGGQGLTGPQGTFNLQTAITAATVGQTINAPVATYGPIVLPYFTPLTGAFISLVGLGAISNQGNVTAQTSGSNVTVALVGVEATGQRGTAIATLGSVVRGLTGVAASNGLGTIMTFSIIRPDLVTPTWVFVINNQPIGQ